MLIIFAEHDFAVDYNSRRKDGPGATLIKRKHYNTRFIYLLFFAPKNDKFYFESVI